MSAPSEVLLSTEVSGQLFNICVWDHISGTHLVTYKGASSAPRTLCLLQQDYILSAVSNKPLIHVWSTQRKDQVQQRIVCPGVVTALTTSPDGLYCVAGIGEKVHIWQVATGNLLAVLTRHYQTITCLAFTDDGSHFVSGGEDNLVLVWSLASVLADKTSEGSEPKHIWPKHSLPITDVHIGCGGVMSRVWTASLDHTVKLWDLASGCLLMSVVFDHRVTAVTTDTAEMILFAGTSSGRIYPINLFEMPARTERHLSNDEMDTSNIFIGHGKPVTCLAVYSDGSRLVSGSKDFSVKIWDIESKQCMKTLTHKGVITNLKLIQPPKKMLSHDVPRGHVALPLEPFKRYLHGSQRQAQEHGDKPPRPVIKVRPKPKQTNTEVNTKLLEECMDCVEQQKHHAVQTDIMETDSELTSQIQHLHKVNKDIYKFAIKQILKKGT